MGYYKWYLLFTIDAKEFYLVSSRSCLFYLKRHRQWEPFIISKM
jgi:hypothetical protein